MSDNKVYVHSSIPETVGNALKQVMGLAFPITETIDDARVVILQQCHTLESIHDFRRVYLLFRANRREELPQILPENVRALELSNFVVEAFTTDLSSIRLVTMPTVTAPADAPRVLVIDDTLKHIQAAYDQLGATCRLTTATTYLQGLEHVKKGSFDAVLTDVMMPASSMTLSANAVRMHAGQSTVVDRTLWLLAAKRGVKRIGVVTDANHHSHPASADIDNLEGHVFRVEDAKVIFTNRMLTADDVKDWKGLLERVMNA